MTDQKVDNELELVIERVLDVPRDLVFKVWTEPKHIENWFGPEGFDTRVEKCDFRPGGQFRYVMVGPDGAEYPTVGSFMEIVPPERVVVTDEFGDQNQSRGLSGMVSTVTFEDQGDRTRIEVRVLHTSPEQKKTHEDMGMVTGWQSSFDCMERYLETLAD